MKEKAQEQWPQQPRLYPTRKEEKAYRELKQRYGFKDSQAVEAQGHRSKQEGSILAPQTFANIQVRPDEKSPA